MLRRERVRARDIFRFGTGMIRTPLKKDFYLATGYQVADENYLGKSPACKNAGSLPWDFKDLNLLMRPISDPLDYEHDLLAS